MTELPIYNCHIHTFTDKNAPPYILKLQFRNVLGYILSKLVRNKTVVGWLISLMKWISPGQNEPLERHARFIETGELGSQKKIFEQIQKQYPIGTNFIVLPMDMEHIKLGAPRQGIDQQHNDLLKLAKESNGHIIPFYAADPRRRDIVRHVKDNLGRNKFRGIKIYPNLGYFPYDKNLMKIYSICEKGGFPVISHCMTGGVWEYGLSLEQRREFANPNNYKQVLEAHPKLKVCLAHFGGADEWEKHLKGRNESLNSDSTWVKTIYDMIDSGKYPNLYADISYTIFTPRFKDMYIDLIDYLKVLLSNKRIRKHVLFGSDYYMVEQEELSEKEVSIMLRSRLGEDLYFQIAHHNPRAFLGLKTRKTGAKKK